jgi:hypothetical protein
MIVGKLLVPLLGWAILALPPTRNALEASMTLHMLVQIPALAVVGVLLANLPGRNIIACGRIAWTTGLAAVVAGLFILMMWMIPTLLDAAVLDWPYEAAKFLGVPVGGCLVRIGWPALPTVARLILHVEILASCFRFGWAYIEAPNRLCSAYLIESQQIAGSALMLLGGIYSIELAAVAVTGISVLGTAWKAIDTGRAAACLR